MSEEHVGGEIVPLKVLETEIVQESQPTQYLEPATDYGARLRTDAGNGLRIIDAFGNLLRYVDEQHQWLIWDGTHWTPDKTRWIEDVAKQALYRISDECQKCIEDDVEIEQIRSWQMASQNLSRLRAAIDSASSHRRIAATPEMFDRDPDLLNVLNCTIDLRTGLPKPYDQDDMISKIAPVTYDPTAQCPTWDSFLWRAFEGNIEMMTFVQRAIGYTLTGDISEQKFFFLYGFGANGKSTFMSAIRRMMGRDYAMQAERALLLQRANEPHPTGVADLRGKRLAVSSEAAKHRNFDEELIKQLTGGEPVRAHRMRQDNEEFDATFKLWFLANDQPGVSDMTNAMWRRILVIPFKVTIPKEERDPLLETKLDQERSGILNWAIAGCLEWRRIGLDPPSEVIEVTNEYQANENTVNTFIEEKVIRTGSNDDLITKDGLHHVYAMWWTMNDGDPRKVETKKAFGQALLAMDIPWKKHAWVKEDGSRTTKEVWIGLKMI